MHNEKGKWYSSSNWHIRTGPETLKLIGNKWQWNLSQPMAGRCATVSHAGSCWPQRGWQTQRGQKRPKEGWGRDGGDEKEQMPLWEATRVPGVTPYSWPSVSLVPTPPSGTAKERLWLSSHRRQNHGRWLSCNMNSVLTHMMPLQRVTHKGNNGRGQDRMYSMVFWSTPCVNGLYTSCQV